MVDRATNTQVTDVATSWVQGVGEVTVRLKYFAFNPAELDVRRMTQITWINDDSAPNTITSVKFIQWWKAGLL
jgi:plastocyanin